MAPDGTDSSAGPTKIAAHHEEIGDLLHILGPVAMLGEAHAIADDNRLGLNVDVRHPFDLGPRQPRDAQDVIPGRAAQIFRQRSKAERVLLDEREVQHRLATYTSGCLVRLENEFHHALEGRDVTADADLAIFAGNPGRGESYHLDRVLRRGKSLQRPFTQRVHCHDRNAAPRRLAQRGHHPRAVGAGILPNHEDRICLVEIL